MAQVYEVESKGQEKIFEELNSAIDELAEMRKKLESTEKELGEIATWGVVFSAALLGVLALTLASLAAGII